MIHRRAASLAGLPGIAHGFFGRAGGVSEGLYASLNCGLGSRDRQASVAANRARAAAAIGIAPQNLLTLYQIHSPEVVTVREAWSGQGPEADGMVTRTPGIALGVLAADCTPILFADAAAGVIGACHAGWKGALAGVAEATVAAMRREGARDIAAAIGPTIRQPSYEVGAEFRDAFTARDASHARWFAPGKAADKFQFDLPGFLTARLGEAGVTRIEDLAVCTYADGGYFSYRRTTHRGEPDYGRNLSAIALAPEPAP